MLKEPDVGMPERDAHRFFLQLISAVVGEVNLCDEGSSANFTYSQLHFNRNISTTLASPTEISNLKTFCWMKKVRESLNYSSLYIDLLVFSCCLVLSFVLR